MDGQRIRHKCVDRWTSQKDLADQRRKTGGREIREGNGTIIKFKRALPTPPALYFTLPTCHCSVALILNHSCSARTILIPFLCILLHAVPSAQNAPAAHIFTLLLLRSLPSSSHLSLFQEALLVWGRGTPHSFRPTALAFSLSTACRHCSCPSPLKLRTP